MHGAYAGVVEAGADGEGLLDLSVVVLHHEHLGAMENAYRATVERSRRVVGLPTVASGFSQYNAHALVVDIMVDGAGGIAAAAYAGHEVVGVVAPLFLLQLPAYFFGDYALQACHEVGVGVRSHGAAYDVERVRGVAAPVAYGLRASVGERHIASAYGVHLGAEHAHALYVGVLALYVGGAHEHLALQAHEGAHRSRCHAVLSGARLGNNARLAHALGHQYLAYGVVYLVGSRVVEVLAFEVEAAAVALAHAACEVKGRRSPYVVFEQLVILLLESLRLQDVLVLLLQVVHRGVEYLGDVGPSEFSIESFFVNVV